MSLEGLYAEMLAFFRPLWPGEDKPLVLGEGKTDAPALMLIGEAPGETEVIKRRPFVGKAGKNLDEFLRPARWKRVPRDACGTVRPIKRNWRCLPPGCCGKSRR